jgi:hypothetical protein
MAPAIRTCAWYVLLCAAYCVSVCCGWVCAQSLCCVYSMFSMYMCVVCLLCVCCLCCGVCAVSVCCVLLCGM